jgi:hypothetical protein
MEPSVVGAGFYTRRMTGDLDQERTWTNASVRSLSPHADPLTAVSSMVTDLLLSAADEGAVGTPTDPFQLAALMGIGLRPHFDIADARLIAAPKDGSGAPSQTTAEAPLARFVPASTRLIIEYNPTRPRGRLRYSVAHELAHAFFPDAASEPRHRTYTGAVEELANDDSWQLELLCNVAAAEILMPTAAIEGLLDTDTDIDFLMSKRAKFHVSTEALMRRLVHATSRPMALAAFNRVHDTVSAPLRCDYVLTSRAWTGNLERGTVVEREHFPAAPTAVGQTTRGRATIDDRSWNVQTVGTAAYPGRALPRVLALVEPLEATHDALPGLTYRMGDIADAVRDASGRPVIVAHLVNDATHAWGRYGPAGALARVVPDAAKAFRFWTIADPDNLTLGQVHAVKVPANNDQMITVASLVAQAGYGPSSVPRVSYVSLAQALDTLAEVAQSAGEGATVHMPRIGAGEGGGRWDLIEATIERTLLARDIPVVVYTPSSEPASATGGA